MAFRFGRLGRYGFQSGAGTRYVSDDVEQFVDVLISKLTFVDFTRYLHSMLFKTALQFDGYFFSYTA